MPKCVVTTCKSYTRLKKKDGVSYFHFPQSEIQREKWRSIISVIRSDKYYKPISSSVICSKHFHSDDIYTTVGGYTRIKNTAIPTIQLGVSQSKIGEICKLLSPYGLSMIFENTKQQSSDLETDSCSTCTSLSNESILDTPKVTTLRKDLKLCRKRLFKKNNKIKKLQIDNKKLTKENAKLKSVIISLRKQNDLDESILDHLSNHDCSFCC